MLKTIQNLCYKNSVQYNDIAFLVDNILHQQKGAANFQNQLDYVLRRQQAAGSRTPGEQPRERGQEQGGLRGDAEDGRGQPEDRRRRLKASNEDDSGYVKTEAGYYRSGDYYKGYDNDEQARKESIEHTQPGEVLQQLRFLRLHPRTPATSGDNVTRTEDYSTDEIVRSCEVQHGRSEKQAAAEVQCQCHTRRGAESSAKATELT
ncbi:hypothetical protein EVAR_41882_1, partial [Eumeta japonica]